jgi:hypothetical protein
MLHRYVAFYVNIRGLLFRTRSAMHAFAIYEHTHFSVRKKFALSTNLHFNGASLFALQRWSVLLLSAARLRYVVGATFTLLFVLLLRLYVLSQSVSKTRRNEEERR